jgi:hypothetical protein
MFCPKGRASLPGCRYEIVGSGAVNRIGERLTREIRIETGHREVLRRHVRLQRMAADMRRQHDVRKGASAAWSITEPRESVLIR